MRTKTIDLPEGQFDVIAEACSFLGGIGVWSQFLKHMEKAGWSEEEVEAAYAAFGTVLGREL